MLLVGKMPQEVPSGLQVGTEPFWPGWRWGASPPGLSPLHLLFLQLEQLSSHQSLLTHISTSGLPTSLGGGLPYCHQAWLGFRMVSALGGA